MTARTHIPPNASGNAPAGTSERARWLAVSRRAPIAADPFVYAVTTTGIYCRAGCPARTPNRDNVAFFDTAAAARQAGYRACLRCRPDEAGAGHAALIRQACRTIESAETPPGTGDLAAAAGLSPGHFARAFKQVTGITPAAYGAAMRDRRLKEALPAAGSVTDALYEAGFNAPSRAYEAAGKRLGMTPGAARRRGIGEQIVYAAAACWLGRALVAATPRGLCAVQLGDDDAALVAALKERFSRAHVEPAEPGSPYRDWIEAALAAIERPGAAADLPLDIQGTAFQEQVWQALMAIPAGETVTYGSLAERIGRPSATRAVAAACGANRLAILIPCHRVIGKDGTLTGYRWGVERKKKLLAREQG